MLPLAVFSIVATNPLTIPRKNRLAQNVINNYVFTNIPFRLQDFAIKEIWTCVLRLENDLKLVLVLTISAVRRRISLSILKDNDKPAQINEGVLVLQT